MVSNSTKGFVPFASPPPSSRGSTMYAGQYGLGVRPARKQYRGTMAHYSHRPVVSINLPFSAELVSAGQKPQNPPMARFINSGWASLSRPLPCLSPAPDARGASVLLVVVRGQTAPIMLGSAGLGVRNTRIRQGSPRNHCQLVRPRLLLSSASCDHSTSCLTGW